MLFRSLQELARVCVTDDHLLVSEGEVSALISGYGLLGHVKSSRTGLALQPQETDGTILFRTDFPRIRGDFPPGRALAVTLGRPELVQIGMPPA